MSARRHPQSSIDAAVAAYGRESASDLAQRLGCSTGAITHWWAEAKADGRIEGVYGRFDGAAKAKRDPVVKAKRSCALVPGFEPHLAGPNRPDCRTPVACISKGPGLCRGCTGAVMMAKLLSDPERVAARLKKSVEGRDTEAYRETHRRKIAKQRRSKVFREAEAARGRETVARWHADPTLREKANETAKLTLAAKWAERVGVPVGLIGDFRALRRKRLTVEEARAALRRSHPVAFTAFEAERRAAAMKALGPAPAIGMPGRAQWTRRAGAVVASLSVCLDALPRVRDGEGRL